MTSFTIEHSRLTTDHVDGGKRINSETANLFRRGVKNIVYERERERESLASDEEA